MSIQVRAFRDGFFGNERKRVGDEFSVPDSTIESGWFDPIDPSVKLRPRPNLTPAQKAEREKVARGKAKAAERKRIESERQKPAKDKPVALSELAKTVAPTAREGAAQASEDVEPLV